MRVLIAAVGRMKASGLRAAWDDYAGRLTWPVDLREVEARGTDGPHRIAAEAAQLRRVIAPAACVVALDRSGVGLGSDDLATRLAEWRD